MPEPTLDYETYSEAGHNFVPPGTDPKKPLGYWAALPNAPQGKKGLSIVGAAAYSEHPSTEVMSAHYDLCDGRGKRRWHPGQPLPFDLFAHVAAGKPLHCHNAMFEFLIWTNVCVEKYGWPPLNPYVLRCTMATARVNNYPGALGKLGPVLGLDIVKDKAGEALLKRFSVPRNPTKTDPRLRIHPHEDPEGPLLFDYGDTDVSAEQAAGDAMEPMSDDELHFWHIDQEINRRGLAVDAAAIADCCAVLDEVFVQYGAECEAITGGLKATQVQALRGWLLARGFNIPNMRADTIKEVLGDDFRYELVEEDDEELGEFTRPEGYISNQPPPPLLPLTGELRRVIEIRALTGSASVKKLYAIRNRMSRDERLRNLIIHHGARTGRPTGDGPQPLNLPKAGPQLVECGACGKPHKADSDACPWCGVPCPPIARKGKWRAAYVDPVLEIMASRSLALVEYFFGDALMAIQGCVRGLFVAAPGHDLIASDYSAIEAVVLAMLAGEQWRIDAFRRGDPIYLLGASKITGVPLAEYLDYYEKSSPDPETREHHKDRQNIGKVSELACGFGGWIGSYKAFGSQEPDEVIKQQILAWRRASPAIVEFWGGQWRGPPWRREQAELYGMEGAFIAAVQRPDETIRPACCPSIGFRYDTSRDTLHITLPSGRRLAYASPRLQQSDRNPDELSITYMTWNSNPKYGMLGWVRMNTYGGRLTENVVQAVAHDVLRYAIVQLRAAGYPTVLHVYDEIVVEVPHGVGSVEEVERIMATMPPWAADWPISAAGGWRGFRYRKG